ncbi:hypothetical protein [Paenarthrobacter sp. NPDC057981]|uniref:hypothetical protein n=1 Tax=Paenarthrobacter sp. NPDC057981 TaxID=3346297 RepID=UPI0036D772B1
MTSVYKMTPEMYDAICSVFGLDADLVTDIKFSGLNEAEVTHAFLDIGSGVHKLTDKEPND